MAAGKTRSGITVGEWQSELDRILAEAAPKQIPIGTGITPAEYAQRHGMTHETARRRLVKLEQSGKLKIIGKRSCANVYDVA